jgi:hypothetical protein
MPDGNDGRVNGEDYWPFVGGVTEWVEHQRAGDEVLDDFYG